MGFKVMLLVFKFILCLINDVMFDELVINKVKKELKYIVGSFEYILII